MQSASEIPQAEIQAGEVSVGKRSNVIQEKVGGEEEREQLKERSEEQRREDEERIAEIRNELGQKSSEQETNQPTLIQEGNQLSEREKLEKRMNDLGFKKSDDYTGDELAGMQQVAKSNLQNTFPEYGINERLIGAEHGTFVADRTSFNEFALKQRFPNINERLLRILKSLPLPAAGFAFGGSETVINGGLPRFLVKRTMYHEDLHLASAGLLPTPINEGATEYYARQAAVKEGVSQNIMNPRYFPRSLAFALMSQATGESIAKEAYFKGQINEFQSAVDDKWGEDSYLKINRLSHGFFGVRATAYSAFKWLTSR